MIKNPTDKQIELAKKLGISDVEKKSRRVLSAEITDSLEIKSFNYVSEKKLTRGDNVTYIGKREDVPKKLIISKVSTNGYLYFKGLHKYCRPWDVVKK